MAELFGKSGGTRRASTGGRRADELPVGTTQRRFGTSPAPHGRAPCVCRALVLCGASRSRDATFANKRSLCAARALGQRMAAVKLR